MVRKALLDSACAKDSLSISALNHPVYDLPQMRFFRP